MHSHESVICLHSYIGTALRRAESPASHYAGVGILQVAMRGPAMPDLTPYLGVLGTLVTVVGGPAMSAIIQNRRTHRLRSSVSENIKLRKELEESTSPAVDDHVRQL